MTRTQERDSASRLPTGAYNEVVDLRIDALAQRGIAHADVVVHGVLGDLGCAFVPDERGQCRHDHHEPVEVDPQLPQVQLRAFHEERVQIAARLREQVAERRWLLMTMGRKASSSKFPSAPAIAIVAYVGLTLPGMMVDPGSFAGMRSSYRPWRGPDVSHRRSLAILNSVTTVDFKDAWARTIGSKVPWAANGFWAGANG